MAGDGWGWGGLYAGGAVKVKTLLLMGDRPRCTMEGPLGWKSEGDASADSQDILPVLAWAANVAENTRPEPCVW